MCSFLLFFVNAINKNIWFTITACFILGSFVIVRFLLALIKKKNKQLFSFSCFFITFICSIIVLIIYKSNLWYECFIFALISYWMMMLLYDLYIEMTGKEVLSSKATITLFFILSLACLGIKIEISIINISFILLVFLSFIVGNIGFSEGVTLTFLNFLMLILLNYKIESSFLFFIVFLLSYFLKRTNKITIFFIYSLIIFFFIYKMNLNYLISFNYLIGAVMYIILPNKILNKINIKCSSSENYLIYLKEKNDHRINEISNKIKNMSEAFNLSFNKLNLKGRIKKKDKEILIEEIAVFKELLNNLTLDIKKDQISIEDKIEKIISTMGFEIITIKENKTILNESYLNLEIRCDREDLNLLVNNISKELKRHFVIKEVKQKDISLTLKVKLAEEKSVSIKFGVSQKAFKDNICGDSYLIYEDTEYNLYLLSDGMGNGEEAKKRSKLLIDLFVKFRKCRVEIDKSILFLNYILKSEHFNDSYATLDLLVYDKNQNKFYFYKNGSCCSYIINSKGINVIYGNELPIGIVDNISLKKEIIEIDENSYIVMVSDGINESFVKKFSKYKNKEASYIAREIIKNNDNKKDDESVIVIEINKPNNIK